MHGPVVLRIAGGPLGTVHFGDHFHGERIDTVLSQLSQLALINYINTGWNPDTSLAKMQSAEGNDGRHSEEP